MLQEGRPRFGHGHSQVEGLRILVVDRPVHASHHLVPPQAVRYRAGPRHVPVHVGSSVLVQDGASGHGQKKENDKQEHL